MQTLADDLGVAVQIAADVESMATGIAQLAHHHARGVTLEENAAQWRAAQVL